MKRLLVVRLALVACVCLVGVTFAETAAAENRGGYCLGGTYLDLEIGQNLTDPLYARATPAFEVLDTRALTCTLPVAMAPTGQFDGLYPIVYYQHVGGPIGPIVPRDSAAVVPQLFRLSAPKAIRVGQDVFFISVDYAPARLCYKHGTSAKRCMWAQAGSWEIHVLPGHEQYFTLVIDRTVRAHLVYRDVI